MIYEIVKTENQSTMLKATDKEGKVFWIPLDPANSDYQRYLRWLEDPTATDQPIGGNK
jgi:hypothetical protein